MPSHRFLPPDPRPSKAHPEHRRRRKELEKEHNYEWVPPIILGLLGITLAFDVTKDVAKAEEKKLKDRWNGDDEGSNKDEGGNDARKSKSRSKSRRGDTGDRRGRDQDRDRGESRRSQRQRSRKPWDIDDNGDGNGSVSEERGKDGRRRSRRWQVYEPDDVPGELAAAVGVAERDRDRTGERARQREAEAWRRADLMEKGHGTVSAAAERGRRSSLDQDEGYYSRGEKRDYRDAGYDYGYDGYDDLVDDYDRGTRERGGRAAVEEHRRRPRQRRRSSDW